MSEIQSLTLYNVYFSYGDETVLEGLSFTAKRGDHLVIKGESGSGKSTILQLLLGFLKSGEGEIVVEKPGADLRKHSAWLPQDLDLGEGSVKELMDHLFQFEANRSAIPPADRRVDTLRRLGLSKEEYLKSFRDLSTGQRQRVGLAICALLDKEVLLLDEPTSALDLASKQKAARLLLSDPDKIIISTSHDPFWVDKGTKIVEVS